jgi:hypothetical protein
LYASFLRKETTENEKVVNTSFKMLRTIEKEANCQLFPAAYIGKETLPPL